MLQITRSVVLTSQPEAKESRQSKENVFAAAEVMGTEEGVQKEHKKGGFCTSVSKYHNLGSLACCGGVIVCISISSCSGLGREDLRDSVDADEMDLLDDGTGRTCRRLQGGSWDQSSSRNRVGGKGSVRLLKSALEPHH